DFPPSVMFRRQSEHSPRVARYLSVGRHQPQREKLKLQEMRPYDPPALGGGTSPAGRNGRCGDQLTEDQVDRSMGVILALAGADEREWLISTDFSRAVAVLKDRLADPTADAACETLLVAHEIGGGGLDGRLAALVDDRTQDLQGRKDARAKQAAVRFARRFVL